MCGTGQLHRHSPRQSPWCTKPLHLQHSKECDCRGGLLPLTCCPFLLRETGLSTSCSKCLLYGEDQQKAAMNALYFKTAMFISQGCLKPFLADILNCNSWNQSTSPLCILKHSYGNASVIKGMHPFKWLYQPLPLWEWSLLTSVEFVMGWWKLRHT